MKLHRNVKHYEQMCRLLLEFFKMAAVAMETAKMLKDLKRQK
jgi:nucleoside phosphorylase